MAKKFYATNVTADQAIAWVQSQVGKALDVDGAYGAQCVDLIMEYNGKERYFHIQINQYI